MPTVEDVRLILERTFVMPVAESDAQIVLDRLNEITSNESAQQSVEPTCPNCGGIRNGHYLGCEFAKA